MGSTKIDLVKDLEPYLKEFGGYKKQELINLIARAKKGEYHDFESLLDMPKTQLHMELSKLGLTEIDRKMQNGDYDE